MFDESRGMASEISEFQLGQKHASGSVSKPGIWVAGKKQDATSTTRSLKRKAHEVTKTRLIFSTVKNAVGKVPSSHPTPTNTHPGRRRSWIPQTRYRRPEHTNHF